MAEADIYIDYTQDQDLDDLYVGWTLDEPLSIDASDNALVAARSPTYCGPDPSSDLGYVLEAASEYLPDHIDPSPSQVIRDTRSNNKRKRINKLRDTVFYDSTYWALVEGLHNTFDPDVSVITWGKTLPTTDRRVNNSALFADGDYYGPSDKSERRSLKTANRFYYHLDKVGRGLLKSGFPMIATGSSCVVFLITEHKVIKVPSTHRNKSYEDSLEQLERALAISFVYPNVFAKTIHCKVKLRNKTLTCYVQRRVYGPFIHWGLSAQDIAKHNFSVELDDMLFNNPDVKQFGISESGELIGVDFN
jgi:hypothetical protein